MTARQSHSVMPIDYIPDWEQRVARFDAFWECEIIDRPVVFVQTQKEDSDYLTPAVKQRPNHRERWMDSEYVAEQALSYIMSFDYHGDALPQAGPNLGPDVFAAFFGCELEFGEATSWSAPSMEDWSDVDKIRFSDDNMYWAKINEITDALLSVGKGRFYTAITDLHTGGDALAALRGPENLAVDMIDSLDSVKELLAHINEQYPRVFDSFHEKLRNAGQLPSSFMVGASTRKWYWVSNDFSCMISREMFDEVFLPGIINECRFLDASMYHLDGPGALRHLDSMLEIKELNAVQWQYGVSNGRGSDWMHIYKKCQDAGKGIQIYPDIDELDFFMENLRPEGVQVYILRTDLDKDEAEAIIKKISQWK